MESQASHDAAAGLRVDFQHDDESATAHVTVSGDLDELTVDRLQQALLEIMRRHRPVRIDIDTAGITFVGSAGLRGLVVSQADARQVGCHIVLVNVPPMVRYVLRVTALLQHFGVAEEPA